MLCFVARSRRFFWTVLLVMAPLSACNFKEEKDADSDDVTVDPSTPVSYDEIRAQILEPSCLGCHSSAGSNQGGVNLETYAAVKALSAAIKSSTVDSTRMPKFDTLSASKRALLGAWIAQGTPE